MNETIAYIIFYGFSIMAVILGFYAGNLVGRGEGYEEQIEKAEKLNNDIKCL